MMFILDLIGSHCKSVWRLEALENTTTAKVQQGKTIGTSKRSMNSTSFSHSFTVSVSATAPRAIDLSRFLRCASLHKDFIQLQPHTINIMVGPDILAPSITEGVSTMVGLASDQREVRRRSPCTDFKLLIIHTRNIKLRPLYWCVTFVCLLRLFWGFPGFSG